MSESKHTIRRVYVRVTSEALGNISHEFYNSPMSSDWEKSKRATPSTTILQRWIETHALEMPKGKTAKAKQ